MLQKPWKLTRQDLRQLKLALDQRGFSETTLAPEREAALDHLPRFSDLLLTGSCR